MKAGLRVWESTGCDLGTAGRVNHNLPAAVPLPVASPGDSTGPSVCDLWQAICNRSRRESSCRLPSIKIWRGYKPWCQGVTNAEVWCVPSATSVPYIWACQFRVLCVKSVGCPILLKVALRNKSRDVLLAFFPGRCDVCTTVPTAPQVWRILLP
jgi:hypothetical protein